MEATKVGIREFRADFAELIAASSPVAVTATGQDSRLLHSSA